jgi:hypothetical protein
LDACLACHAVQEIAECENTVRRREVLRHFFDNDGDFFAEEFFFFELSEDVWGEHHNCLQAACWFGLHRVAQGLLAHLGHSKVDILSAPDFERSLQNACVRGAVECVRVLLNTHKCCVAWLSSARVAVVAGALRTAVEWARETSGGFVADTRTPSTASTAWSPTSRAVADRRLECVALLLDERNRNQNVFTHNEFRELLELGEPQWDPKMRWHPVALLLLLRAPAGFEHTHGRGDQRAVALAGHVRRVRSEFLALSLPLILADECNALVWTYASLDLAAVRTTLKREKEQTPELVEALSVWAADREFVAGGMCRVPQGGAMLGMLQRLTGSQSSADLHDWLDTDSDALNLGFEAERVQLLLHQVSFERLQTAAMYCGLVINGHRGVWW